MSLESMCLIDMECNMRRNKGKTEYARLQSIMARLDNEIKKQITEQKKNSGKKIKEGEE